MAKTVVGQFDSAEYAQQTVSALINNGIPAKAIKVDQRPRGEIVDDFGIEGRTPFGELMGVLSVIGTVLGVLCGLIAGMGYLGTAKYGLVPPGGNIFTPIGWMLLGSGIGALIGAILGAIIGAILRAAGILVAGIRRGRTQVTVRTEDSLADQASSIMHRYNAVAVDYQGGSH